MKILFTLALVCGALLLGGCTDNSLMSDEDYENSRRPAPYPPDPMRHMPASPHTRSGRY